MQYDFYSVDFAHVIDIVSLLLDHVLTISVNRIRINLSFESWRSSLQIQTVEIARGPFKWPQEIEVRIMANKFAPYTFRISSRPLDTAEEDFASAKFGPVEVEWERDDLLALLMQPSISHNLYKGEERSYGHWIGMKSVIMDVPLPKVDELEALVAKYAERIKADICGYPVSSGMLWMEETRDKLRLLVPFDRLINDPDERDKLRAYLMSNIAGVPTAAFNLETVYAQELMDGGISVTQHHGPLNVDEVLEYVPEPGHEITLPLTTEVETVAGDKVPLNALKIGDKFICPVCRDHKLPAPEGMNIVEHREGKSGRSSYGCPWCQVLKNNYIGVFEFEAKPQKLAKGK